jgi:hypothetical protein
VRVHQFRACEDSSRPRKCHVNERSDPNGVAGTDRCTGWYYDPSADGRSALCSLDATNFLRTQHRSRCSLRTFLDASNEKRVKARVLAIYLRALQASHSTAILFMYQVCDKTAKTAGSGLEGDMSTWRKKGPCCAVDLRLASKRISFRGMFYMYILLVALQ